MQGGVGGVAERVLQGGAVQVDAAADGDAGVISPAKLDKVLQDSEADSLFQSEGVRHRWKSTPDGV